MQIQDLYVYMAGKWTGPRWKCVATCKGAENGNIAITLECGNAVTRNLSISLSTLRTFQLPIKRDLGWPSWCEVTFPHLGVQNKFNLDRFLKLGLKSKSVITSFRLLLDGYSVAGYWRSIHFSIGNQIIDGRGITDGYYVLPMYVKSSLTSPKHIKFIHKFSSAN